MNSKAPSAVILGFTIWMGMPNTRARTSAVDFPAKSLKLPIGASWCRSVDANSTPATALNFVVSSSTTAAWLLEMTSSPLPATLSWINGCRLTMAYTAVFRSSGSTAVSST
jgi:hypothetical protein